MTCKLQKQYFEMLDKISVKEYFNHSRLKYKIRNKTKNSSWRWKNLCLEFELRRRLVSDVSGTFDFGFPEVPASRSAELFPSVSKWSASLSKLKEMVLDNEADCRLDSLYQFFGIISNNYLKRKLRRIKFGNKKLTQNLPKGQLILITNKLKTTPHS